MIEPIGDKVLVEPNKPEEKTKSGILLSTKEEKQDMGVISAVGDGENVKKFKPSDTIIFERFGPHHFSIDKVEYIIVCIDEILGRINEN